MLILTRKVGEAILIGPEVSVTVLNVRGDRVKLGITAPAVVEVLREELASQVRAMNLAACSSSHRLGGLRGALNASLRPTEGPGGDEPAPAS